MHSFLFNALHSINAWYGNSHFVVCALKYEYILQVNNHISKLAENEDSLNRNRRKTKYMKVSCNPSRVLKGDQSFNRP